MTLHREMTRLCKSQCDIRDALQKFRGLQATCARAYVRTSAIVTTATEQRADKIPQGFDEGGSTTVALVDDLQASSAVRRQHSEKSTS